MPRKTKKQKIIASYRQKLKQLQPAPPSGRDGTIAQKTTRPETVPQNTEDDVGLKQWLMKELRRTAIATGAIIVLELLIFYAKLKGIYRF